MKHTDYLAIPAVSSSLLGHIQRSPAHARQAQLKPHAPTQAQIQGTRIHTAILEPKMFMTSHCVLPSWDLRTVAGKKAKAHWYEDNPHMVALSHDELEQCLAIVEQVYNNEQAANLLNEGLTETSFFGQDDVTKLPLKCRPDHIHDNVIVDVKTTEDGSPRGFSQSIFKYNYHIQAAFYLDLVSVVTGVKRDRFVFITVEKKPPYVVTTYELDEASIDRGRELIRKSLDVWADCVKQDRYPAYSNKIETIAIPPWGFNE